MSEPVKRTRAELPGAAELFRPTRSKTAASPAPKPVTQLDAGSQPEAGTRPSATGRVRHDQKITVYFSSEELFALEDATLELKRRHGVNLDRGRLVRTAVALALADLAENGAQAAVVGELRKQ